MKQFICTTVALGKDPTSFSPWLSPSTPFPPLPPHLYWCFLCRMNECSLRLQSTWQFKRPCLLRSPSRLLGNSTQKQISPKGLFRYLWRLFASMAAFYLQRYFSPVNWRTVLRAGDGHAKRTSWAKCLNVHLLMSSFHEAVFFLLSLVLWKAVGQIFPLKLRYI